MHACRRRDLLLQLQQGRTIQNRSRVPFGPKIAHGASRWRISQWEADRTGLWHLPYRPYQECNNMNSRNSPSPFASRQAGLQTSEISIPELVGEVYEAAPLAERKRLIGYLMRPLGVLSLVAVANGIFAKARFRSTWPDMQLRLEDVGNVQPSDVVALVDRVQQVSIEAIDGLAQLLTASPLLAGSAAAIILVTVLMQRSRNRRAEDTPQPDPASPSPG